MRLIDADALKEKLSEITITGDRDVIGYIADVIKGVGVSIIQAIDSMPTVEAEPVRHGYWIECDYKHMEHGFIETDVNGGLCCSECRTGFKKSDLRIKSYCPNCGAKMDKEE